MTEDDAAGRAGDKARVRSADEVRSIVDQLRSSIAPDLYTPDVYIPWAEIDRTLKRLGPAVDVLQHIVDSVDWSVDRLSDAIRVVGVIDVVRALAAAPSEVGFADGRELPLETPRSEARARDVAALLLDIGLPQILPVGCSVRDLLRIGVIALDARRRGFRRRDSIEAEVRGLLDDALEVVRQQTGLAPERLPQRLWPSAAKGRTDDVVGLGGVPIAGVVSFFAAQTGGRQQRTLSVTYPELQRALDSVPMWLILILDGRGVRDAPQPVLTRLVESVALCTSRTQARQGELADGLVRAAQASGVRPGRHIALETLIEVALEREGNARADILPTDLNAARVALAEFKSSRPDLALELDPSGAELRWMRPQLVGDAQRIADAFDPQAAIWLLERALGVQSGERVRGDETFVAEVGAMQPDPVLPSLMLIAASSGPADRETIREVARLNRQTAPGSLAALIVPELTTSTSTFSSLQRELATSVVLFDTTALMRIAGHITPRDRFVQDVLYQADLTKTNPFNPTGATRPQMFFGREEEAATLLATLDTNSAALLGGRRIGKTSLMHRAVQSVRDADWNPHYADCQAVGSWRDFAQMARKQWELQLSEEWAPIRVRELVDALAQHGDGKLVILLDEIDNLLAWDAEPHDDHVAEAFFRACRAESQEGRVQFVFSGERRIAARLWDPSSPHWNFCRPIPIRQLSRTAADDLLRVPLQSLGIELSPLGVTLANAWAHTGGHPHLVQDLGTRLIHELNQRAPERRSVVEPGVVDEIVGRLDFQRNYVETYWGQATPFEKLLSVLLVEEGGRTGFARLRDILRDVAIDHDASELVNALRMLDLYGVVDQVDDALVLRVEAFTSALAALGDISTLRDDLATRAREQAR